MGVTPVQGAVYCGPNTIGILQHIVVPEAQDAVSFGFDYSRSGAVRFRAMLPAIDFDDEPGAMANEVGDKMPDRRLPAKMMLVEAFAQYAPQRALGVGHVAAQPPGAANGASWWMMLHAWRFTSNGTPTQPSPIKGDG